MNQSSVQFSRSVMSNFSRPHELQHARPPCPLPTPRVHSNSHPSSWWCHPAISSSVIPFSSCPQSLPASESFPMSQLAWGGQSTGVSALASFLPKNIQGWSPLEWTSWISLLNDKFSQCIKKQRHHFADKGQYSKSYCFSSSHVQLWELDYKEGWAWKNWWFWIALEKTLKSPLDHKEIKLVNLDGSQSWIFIGRIDAEAETPILWLPGVKSPWCVVHWKRPWCWERLKAKGEGGSRGWCG